MRASGEALRKLRDDALAIFLAGVEAANPAAAVGGAIRLGPKGGVLVAGEEIVPPAVLRVAAVGKAACAMARAASEVLPVSLFPGPGIAVTNRENAGAAGRFRVLGAGHPLPDAAGEAAACEVESYISGAQSGDGLLLLLSGGGSAILPAPAAGVTLAEKIAVTQLLLKSGADIHELNTVRKHLSRLKGGGFARRARPAAVEALILSDVIGDDLSTIASGPTAPDPTTFADGVAVLERRGLWGAIPAAARKRLERGARGEIAETPKPGDPIFARVANTIVGSNSLSLDAALSKARALGYSVEVASRQLTGEARDAAGAML